MKREAKLALFLLNQYTFLPSAVIQLKIYSWLGSELIQKTLICGQAIKRVHLQYLRNELGALKLSSPNSLNKTFRISRWSSWKFQRGKRLESKQFILTKRMGKMERFKILFSNLYWISGMSTYWTRIHFWSSSDVKQKKSYAA